MAMVQKKVDEYTCDGCGKVICVDVDEPVDGIKGNMFIETTGGGWPADFYACKKSCLSKAVIAAYDRPDDR